MPLKNRVLAKFYPTPHDKADLEALAKRTGQSFSELVCRLTSGRQPMAANDKHLIVRDLLRINADLARLGNLMKLILDDESLFLPDGMDFHGLFDSIRETQILLKSKVRELN